MHRVSQVTTSLACVSLFALMGVASHAQDASLAQLPLLTQSNLSYLGSFALPNNDGSGSAQGNFAYSGQALSVTPQGTLLLGGHTWHSSLCEVSIPGIGGTATVSQPCVDVTEGRLSQIDADEIELGGSLVYGGRLIVSAYSYYDADGSQTLSHFVSGTTLAAAGDVVGPVQVGTAGAGFVSGYMGLVPPEWQTTLGGTALTGNCCIPIISRTSSGPALSVFNPDDVGAVSPVPATQLLGYTLAHALANADTQNGLYTRSDVIGGVAFPSGTRSVLFIGRHGTGQPCYGEGSACADPSFPYKGEHSYPYTHQVWAYNASDLVAVKEGRMAPYDVKPYATWSLSEINSTGSATINGAFFDPTTNRIYITERYADNPRVHVYQVSGGSTAAAADTPTPPTAATPPSTATPPTTTAPTPTAPTTTEPTTTEATTTEATTIAPATTTTRTRTWRRRGRWSR